MLGANLYRLSGDHGAYVRHLAAANGHSDLSSAVAIARIQDAIVAGDWKEAMKQVDTAGTSIGEARYLMRAYAAAAALLDRNAAEANQRVAALLKDVDADKDISVDSRKLLKAYAAALTTPDDVASSPAMRENVIFLNHVYFFMAARAAAAGDAARARELFRKSATASFDLHFPFMASRRLASS